ncbi:hypothetical protein E2P71_05595 [Candidatus Bathyarchaeota archaeon]|nr:hypothetical protein E2P71_05595 [Candidatus Bathyarchaeota archaeon]
MISYVKLYGPPVYDAIKELEKIAITMPEVCIMSSVIAASVPNYAERQEGSPLTPGGAYQYFAELGEITQKRCNTIISKSGQKLGEYDFFFEWFKNPTMDELNDLIKRIDKALTPLNVRYTITTR